MCFGMRSGSAGEHHTIDEHHIDGMLKTIPLCYGIMRPGSLS